MIAYIDETGDKFFEDCDTPEQKDRLGVRFYTFAKSKMQYNNLNVFRYAVIDFVKDQSTVYIVNREVTETFSITGR